MIGEPRGMMVLRLQADAARAEVRDRSDAIGDVLLNLCRSTPGTRSPGHRARLEAEFERWFSALRCTPYGEEPERGSFRRRVAR